MPTTTEALVQVPVPVSALELETLQPIRQNDVPPEPVAMLVQPLGRLGGLPKTSFQEKTIFRLPVFVALNPLRQ